MVALLAVVFVVTPYLIHVGGDRRQTTATGSELVGDGMYLVTRHATLLSVQRDAGQILETLKTTWWGNIIPDQTLYRPVPTFLLGVAGALAGPYNPGDPADRAVPYHILALALHAICALLVLELAWLILRNRSLAFAAGALFAALPVHGEVLFDVAGIAELSCTALSLGAWCAWIRAGDRPFARPLQLGLALGLLFLATLSKESAYALPLVFFLMDLGLAGGLRGALAKLPALLCCGAVLGLSLGLRIAVVGSLLPEWDAEHVLDNPMIAESVGVLEQTFNSIRLMGAGVLSMVGVNTLSSNWNYSSDYSFNQIEVLSAFHPLNLLALVLVGGSVVLALMALRRAPTRAGLWLAMLGSMLLTSNLFFDVGTIYADRLLFFPSVAFVLFLVAMIGKLGTPRVAAVAAVVLALGGGLWLHTNAKHWSTRKKLVEYTADRTARDSARAHNNLGTDYLQGDIKTMALGSFDRALEIKPEFALAHAARALVLELLVRNEEAIDAYRTTADLTLERQGFQYDPDQSLAEDSLPLVVHKMTSLALESGDPAAVEAQLEWLDDAIAGGYESPLVHHKRAECLRVLDRFDEAENAFRRSLAIETTPEALLSFGSFLERRGRAEEALPLYRDAPEFENPSARSELLLKRADLEYHWDPDQCVSTVERLLGTQELRGALTNEQFFRAHILLAVGKLAQLQRDPAAGRDVLEEIEGHYSQALKRYQEPNQETFLAYHHLISVTYALGKYEEARRQIEELLRQTEAPTLRVRLGQIYDFQDRPEDARDQYALALDVLHAGVGEDGSYPDEGIVLEARRLLMDVTGRLGGDEEVEALLQS